MADDTARRSDLSTSLFTNANMMSMAALVGLVAVAAYYYNEVSKLRTELTGFKETYGMTMNKMQEFINGTNKYVEESKRAKSIQDSKYKKLYSLMAEIREEAGALSNDVYSLQNSVGVMEPAKPQKRQVRITEVPQPAVQRQMTKRQPTQVQRQPTQAQRAKDLMVFEETPEEDALDEEIDDVNNEF